MPKYRDAIIAVLLIGFGGFFAYEASRIPEEFFQRSRGIAYYPLLLTGALAAASLLLLARSLVLPREASEKEAGAEEETAGDPEHGQDYGRTAVVLPVLLGVGILVAYVVALALVGFIVSTPVMLVALLLAYGVRDWRVIASLSVGATAVIYLVFYYALKLPLP